MRSQCRHKVLPEARVMDDFGVDEVNALNKDYDLRSWFLRNHHLLECKMMWYCRSRGKNYKNKAAFDYFKRNHLLSEEECATWAKYTDLRNELSHGYFKPELREVLSQEEKIFLAYATALIKKINNMLPALRLKEKKLYEYVHQDGCRSTINLDTMEIKEVNPSVAQKAKESKKAVLKDSLYTESLSDGMKLKLRGKNIIALQMPNGFKVDFEKQSACFAGAVKLFTTAENFNVLKTAECKIFIDKNSHVLRFIQQDGERTIGDGNQTLRAGDVSVLIDHNKYLKELNVKKADGKNVKINFNPTPHGMMMLAEDGMQIIFNDNKMGVSRQ